MPNAELTLKRDLSSFRMIAMGTWKTTKDPSVYGSLSVDVGPALAYIAEFREKTGLSLTLTHLMAKTMGLVLAEMPDANAILRFNRVYLRKDVDVFFQVMMKDPVTGEMDLSGLTIRQADKKPIASIVEEFRRVAAKVRAGKDKEKENTRSTFKKMPGFATGWVLNLIGTLLYTFNLDMRRFGLPKDPFGSVMVTNIGSLGLEEAYVPLVPYSRVPLVVAMGAVVKRTVVDQETEEIQVRPMMRIFATFDHRLLDGSHAGKMATTIKRVFADPAAHFGAIPEKAEEAA